LIPMPTTCQVLPAVPSTNSPIGSLSFLYNLEEGSLPSSYFGRAYFS
jgi:hypothetical protein